MVSLGQEPRFILTMRNVNFVDFAEIVVLIDRFILTMRNVNTGNKTPILLLTAVLY